MAKRLVTVGDLVVDIVMDARLPIQAGRHQTAERLHFEAGGACTTILAARGMGLHVAALGTVGDDMQGRFLRDILRDAAVDTSALIIPPGSSTTTVIALTDLEQGDHVFLGHYGVGADIPFMQPARDLLARADAVFIPGYTLVEDRLAVLVTGVLDSLERAEARVYFDVGPFLGQLPLAQVEQTLNAVDVLLLTEDEIPFVTAGGSGAAACRALLGRFPALTIVLKLAAAGCHIMSGAGDARIPGFAVKVVDTVGAGDAFAAAYIWADLNGHSRPECGTIANAMGAASVARAGAGRKAPSRADVQAILDRQKTGINLSC